jgi:hypothetical protein
LIILVSIADLAVAVQIGRGIALLELYRPRLAQVHPEAALSTFEKRFRTKLLCTLFETAA